MIQDLHSHTYYSFCGKDTPEEIVKAAIAGGIEVFGITDHNHGIGNARRDVLKYPNMELGEDYGRTLLRYFDHINLVKEKYADQIRVLRGIEITTRQTTLRAALPLSADVSFFDYCLIEDLDDPTSITDGDPFRFAERCGCSRGSAIYSAPDGAAAAGLENDADGLFRYKLDDGALDAIAQVVTLSADGAAEAGWRPVRPLPEGGGFFENVWRGYRENGNVY